jgi:rRNA-processing protein FCF1
MSPDQALRVLDELLRELGNVPGHAGMHEAQYRDVYLKWVDMAELQLRNMFPAFEVDETLLTQRYWRINGPDMGSRPFDLINIEVDAQKSALQKMVNRISSVVDRIRSSPGTIMVLDTNTFLHYQLPDSVDWCALVGAKAVRLIVPLRVVEELDAKKWTRNDDLAGRARDALAQMDRLLSSTIGVPVALREATTIEVPVDDGPRYRPMDADEEILLECEEQRAFANEQVFLVTGDTAISLRARARRLDVVSMPEKYLRRPG